jgi:hypothetical protein
MSVSCKWSVSARGLSYRLITLPEESVWCVWVWSCSFDNEAAQAHSGLLCYGKHAQATVGLDRSVGTAAHYWLDGWSSNPNGLGDFPHPSITTRWPSQPSVHWVPGLFPRGKAAEAWRWPQDPSTAEVLNTFTTLQGLHGLFYGEFRFIFYPSDLYSYNHADIVTLHTQHDSLPHPKHGHDVFYCLKPFRCVEYAGRSAVVPGPISWKVLLVILHSFSSPCAFMD